jgi:hypothetical protein
MLGTYAEVHTPLLDRLGDTWGEAELELKRHAPTVLRFGGLSPLGIVLSVSTLAVLGALMLRRP